MDDSVAPSARVGVSGCLRARIGIVATLADYAAIAAVLSADGTVAMFDERSALAAIRGGRLDLLVVGPRNDWWSELPSFVALQPGIKSAHVPVLALVPSGDTAALNHAFDQGVADCAAHPVDPVEVAIRVRSLLRRKQNADRMRAETAAVRRLASTDPVTGLWNRHYLNTDLAGKVAHAAASGRPLSVLMIDIDRFKPINDRYGHTIGDKVLRTVASRLSSGIRAADTLARFGGDELVLIMPDTEVRVAAAVAERLRALVVNGTTEVPFGVTISIGVAELSTGDPPEALLAKADKVLYAAKLAGRDRVEAAVA